ncbi:MAG: hypothetical protein ACLGIM_06260, partial [Alphaproteobacteria bacterium]
MTANISPILNPTFNSRETYLAWRRAWRQTYRALSQEIRDLKQTIKNGMRHGEHMGAEQFALRTARSDAALMMITRLDAKVA